MSQPTLEPIVIQGEPVWIAFEVQNFDKQQTVVLEHHADFWASHRLEVAVDQWGLPGRVANGGAARLTALGKTRNRLFDGMRGKKPTPLAVAPKEKRLLHRFDLTKLIQMNEPGVYIARVVHQERTRLFSPYLRIWVLPRRVAAAVASLNASPLQPARAAALRRQLEPLRMGLLWDPLKLRYRLVTLGYGPLFEPLRPADQHCRKTTECARLDYSCCCPFKRIAARIDRLTTIRARRSKLCAQGSCPDVVCERAGAGLRATCSEGWCVPVEAATTTTRALPAALRRW